MGNQEDIIQLCSETGKKAVLDIQYSQPNEILSISRTEPPDMPYSEKINNWQGGIHIEKSLCSSDLKWYLVKYPASLSLLFKEGSLLRAPDGSFWLIDGGLRRSISSDQALVDLGYSLSDVQDVDQATIDSYVLGDPIVTCLDVNSNRIRSSSISVSKARNAPTDAYRRIEFSADMRPFGDFQHTTLRVYWNPSHTLLTSHGSFDVVGAIGNVVGPILPPSGEDSVCLEIESTDSNGNICTDTNTPCAVVNPESKITIRSLNFSKNPAPFGEDVTITVIVENKGFETASGTSNTLWTSSNFTRSGVFNNFSSGQVFNWINTVPSSFLRKGNHTVTVSLGNGESKSEVLTII